MWTRGGVWGSAPGLAAVALTVGCLLAAGASFLRISRSSSAARRPDIEFSSVMLQWRHGKAHADGVPASHGTRGSGGLGSQRRRLLQSAPEPVPAAADNASAMDAENATLSAHDELQRDVDSVLEGWSAMYGLPDRWPPRHVTQNASLPWAPHLRECVAWSRRMQELEDGTGEGDNPALPNWTCGEEQPDAPGNVSFCSTPDTPWIQGSDFENLPRTRVVQRDLWVRQFRRNCSDSGTRFLLLDWVQPRDHGLGSQIHLLSTFLGISVATDRVAVFTPHTFHRANHLGCHGKRTGSWSCYFADITSEECILQATSLYKNLKGQAPMFRYIEEVMGSDFPVVRLHRENWWYLAKPYTYSIPDSVWGQPWHGEANFEILGGVYPYYDPRVARVSWWHSQAVRFMMRRQTAYLCHQVNKARHGAYGRFVAVRVVAARRAQLAIERGEMRRDMGRHEAKWLFSGAPKESTPLERMAGWRFAMETFLPRPIASIHVRIGDKTREMEVFNLPSYMWAAERLRLLAPNVRYIWLSTEMQSVIDQSHRFPSWTFLYSDIHRQSGDESMYNYQQSLGQERGPGISFANLLIAAECDFFVGVLGSNWNRLINELRMTAGKMSSSYFTLNNAEW